MICPYCEENPFRETRFFNIQNVKERFNPTYYHTQIFNPPHPEAGRIRCTPTFHSRALQTDGYQHSSKQNPTIGQLKDKSKTTYCIHYRQTKDNTNCGRGRSCYKSKEKWYDEDKNEIFKNQKDDCCYSKERKALDMASSSVFNSFQFVKDYQCPPHPNSSQIVKDQERNSQQKRNEGKESNSNEDLNEIDEQDSNKQKKKQTDKQGIKQANKQTIKETVIQQEVTFGKKKGDTLKKTNNSVKTVKIVNERPKFTVIRSKK